MHPYREVLDVRRYVAYEPADAKISLDTVISTMWQTAQDLDVKYKETAEGRLALQIAVNVTE